MALSINLKNEVLDATETAIQASDYNNLRTAILARQPLNTVEAAMAAYLANEFNREKHLVSTNYIRQACESQTLSDHNDENADHQEDRADQTLGASLNGERHQLEIAIATLQGQFINQSQLNNQAPLELQALQGRLNDVNHELVYVQYLIQYNRSLQMQQNIANHNHNHGHNHHHHQHHARFGTIYLGFNLARLLNQEGALVMQARDISNQISNKSAQVNAEAARLNSIKHQKDVQEANYKEVNRKLNSVLPEKARNRAERHLERQQRADARNTQDPDLKQLSARNHSTVMQQIQRMHNELDATHNQMTRQVSEMSYPMFLARLNQALIHNHQLPLAFAEREALNLLITNMNQYSEMEKREALTRGLLAQAQSTLDKHNAELRTLESQLNTYQHQRPNLSAANHKINEENVTLSEDAKKAGKIRNYLLIAAAVALLAAIGFCCPVLIPLFLAVPIIISAEVIPFLIVAGILAAVSIGTFIAGMVRQYKKSSYENQILENEETINKNSSDLSNQSNEAAILESTTIPGKKREIEQWTATVTSYESDLNNHLAQMALVRNNMENVNANSVPVNQMLFPSAPPNNAHHNETVVYDAPPPAYNTNNM